MTWLGAILLAVAAGITEILPVSGSGHLYIFDKVLGLGLSREDMLATRGALQLGVALALLLFYRRQVWQMLRELFVVLGLARPAERRRGVPFPRRLLLLLLLSGLPMFLCLALDGLRAKAEAHDAVLVIVSGLLVVSGLLLYFSGRSAREKKDLQQMTLGDGLIAGLFQVPTVFPGLSRSGLLLSACLMRGLDTGSALEFTGLMGIPTFLLSGLIQWIGARKTGLVTVPPLMLAVGLVVSAIMAMITLRVATERLSYRKPTGFAYWCWGAALLTLILFLVAA